MEFHHSVESSVSFLNELNVRASTWSASLALTQPGKLGKGKGRKKDDSVRDFSTHNEFSSYTCFSRDIFSQVGSLLLYRKISYELLIGRERSVELLSVSDFAS